MNILVTSATIMEIAEFDAEKKNVDTLITGVGAPACLYALTKKLSAKKYDLVIQAGIAGTFKNAFAPGETFAVASDLFGDLGIYEKNNFFTLFDKGFAQKDVMPYTDGRLLNKSAGDYGLPLANSITVNTVTDHFASAELYIKKFNADIESMEGAAFHYVCLNEGIPFIQIRSISNFVGERLKTNWKMKESLQSLNHHLKRIINKLSEGE